jgi:hypothetical protein
MPSFFLVFGIYLLLLLSIDGKPRGHGGIIFSMAALFRR